MIYDGYSRIMYDWIQMNDLFNWAWNYLWRNGIWHDFVLRNNNQESGCIRQERSSIDLMQRWWSHESNLRSYYRCPSPLYYIYQKQELSSIDHCVSLHRNSPWVHLSCSTSRQKALWSAQTPSGGTSLSCRNSRQNGRILWCIAKFRFVPSWQKKTGISAATAYHVSWCRLHAIQARLKWDCYLTFFTRGRTHGERVCGFHKWSFLWRRLRPVCGLSIRRIWTRILAIGSAKDWTAAAWNCCNVCMITKPN